MDHKNSQSASYAAAGVDITAGYKAVELMKKHVKETMRPEVLGGIGGFSGAFSFTNCLLHPKLETRAGFVSPMSHIMMSMSWQHFARSIEL